MLASRRAAARGMRTCGRTHTYVHAKPSHARDLEVVRAAGSGTIGDLLPEEERLQFEATEHDWGVGKEHGDVYVLTLVREAAMAVAHLDILTCLVLIKWIQTVWNQSF
jgi:hypothetical protein